MNKPTVPIWGWACVGGIVGVFGLMALRDAEPNQYLVGALVIVAAFILGVSLPPPWGNGRGGSEA